MDQTEQIIRIFRDLLSVFPVVGSGADGDAALRGYMIAIEGNSAGDIREACRRLMAGEVAEHDGRYTPTPPQIGRAVRSVRDARLESEHRSNPTRTLSPPAIEHSQEERARIVAMADAAVANLTASMRTEDAAAEKRRKEAWAKTNARFAPDMSPEAIKARLMPETFGYSAGDPDGDRDVA